MPQVHLSTALRAQAENQTSVNAEGGSGGEVLGALCQRYPALGQRLYQADGRINRFVNVYLNDEDIRFLEDLGTPVKPSDELSLLLAIAGG